ncbi:MAG: VCBS repeat-containing protein, partial [Cyanobacteria bacterium P01_A01_bin.15]
GSITFVDVDGDEDLDIFIRGTKSFDPPVALLYLNDGDGNFTESINNDFETSIHNGSVAFADIDDDQDQDLLLAGRKSSGSNFTKLYLNNGSGVYSEILNTTFPEIQDGSIGFADIDNDQDQDIFITGNGEGFATSTFFLNDGKGNYLAKEMATIEPIMLGSHAFGDIDNDNDLDLVTSGLGLSKGPNTRTLHHPAPPDSLAAKFPHKSICQSQARRKLSR